MFYMMRVGDDKAGIMFSGQFLTDPYPDSTVLSLATGSSQPVAAAPVKGLAGREMLPFKKPYDGLLIY